MDAVLVEYAVASSDGAEERLGGLLTAHASTVINRVLASRLGFGATDADDVRAQVVLQLMLRLRHARLDNALGTIESFGAYVATAAHHGCDHYLRAKYPLRWQLRNRLRYAMEHDRRFALWKSAEGTWRCGRPGWETRPTAAAPPADALAGLAPAKVKELLARLFELSGGPLELTTIVDLAAEAWQVPLVPGEQMDRLEQFADGSSGADTAMVQRQRAEQAWQEIRLLPVRQRQALLLNLKDDALALFLFTGTASLRALATALEMDVAALARLWHALPLPDTDVALRIGCTRQQVINLRMAARKRLANRLNDPG